MEAEITELRSKLNVEKIQSDDKNDISDTQKYQKNGIISQKRSVSNQQDIEELKQMLDDEKTSNEKKREILGELRMSDILSDEEPRDEDKNGKRAKK